MSLVRQGNMICFDEGPSRFQLRAVGVAVREGHLLVHRATYEDFWSLPGGRVERDESASQTLAREMVEELEQPVTVGPLLHVIENFFTLGARHYHELGLYHAMEVPGAFPFATDGGIVHRIRDGQADLEFKWVKLDAASLAAVGLRPLALAEALLGGAPVHFVSREIEPLPLVEAVP